MGFIVQHRGDFSHIADEIVADDDDGQPGGADVLLRPGIDNAVFGDIDLLRKGCRRTYPSRGECPSVSGMALELGAIDRVVGGDVNIVARPA